MNNKIISAILTALVLAYGGYEWYSVEEPIYPGAPAFQKEWDNINNTLTIKSLNGTTYLTIQQISHVPDLCSCEETFNITSYVNYEIGNLKDFRIRWQKHQGIHNITSSEWHIQKNQSYNVPISDYGDILKEQTIPNIMTHKNITDTWECNETECNLGDCSSLQKWNIIRGTANGTETGIVCFDTYEVMTTSPLKIKAHWGETGILGAHDETRHRLVWNKFSPVGKTLQKNKSYIIKLVFKKKPELGPISIKTIPMFGGLEEQNLTWWNISWNKKREVKVNNTGGSALTYYQLHVNLTDTPINETSLRVVNETANAVVPHWCENITSDNCTKLWFNGTSLPNAAWLNDTYYIYYDSPSVSSASDGTSTFEFFDDFESDNMFDDGYYTDIINTTLPAYGEPTALGEADQIDLWYWGGSGQHMYYANSTNGIYYNDPIELTDVAAGWGRSHVLKHNNTYYMYVVDVDASSHNFRLYTGTNKINFTSQGTVLTYNASNAWENNMLGNLFVWVENTNDWYMLYEAKGSEWKIGLATSTDGTNWTRYASNPVIDGTNSGNPELARIGSTILKHNNKYYLYTHEQIGTTWEIHRWYSSDLHSWTDEGETDGIVKTPSGYSHGDHALSQFQSKTYMWWSPSNQVNLAYINVVIDDRTYAEILALAPDYSSYNITDKWTGNTPYATVSGGKLTYLGDGSWRRMYSKEGAGEKTFGPTMAGRYKGEISGKNADFGFCPSTIAHRVTIYNTGFLSHDGTSQEITTGRWNYNIEYIFDIMQIAGTSDKFYINDVLDTTHTTNPGNAAVPVEVSSYNANSILDWVLVRKYASPEPSLMLGIEEQLPQSSPSLSGQTPSTPHISVYGTYVAFNATSNQTSNNKWLLDSVLQEWDNSTTSPSYTNSTGELGTYNVTLVAYNSVNVSLYDVMSWSWTVTFLPPPDIVNGVYGFLNNTIPSNATILDYKNESIVTTEATIDWDSVTSNIWNNYKAAVNYSYSINRRTALRMNCGGAYNTTTYDDAVKLNITTYMPDLKIDPYQTDLQYIVINLTNTSASDSDKTSFVNNISQNISEQTNNKFKTVVIESLSGLDSAWVSVSPVIYIELDYIPGWIYDEAKTLRGNTTLSRVYSGNESFLSTVYDHKINILNKMRGTSNISNQYTETYSVKVGNDIVLYNNGSLSTNQTVVNADAGYYWALENDTMMNISGGAVTIGFWIGAESYDYIIKESSLNRIIYESDDLSQLWGAETIVDQEAAYHTGAYVDAYVWAGDHTDLRAEFWDPSYTKENTFMIHYEWINASAIKEYSVYDYIIIADQNANEINNTIGRLNDTYGYVSVADYSNTESWQTDKTVECDVWIDSYHTNIFIDGIDFAAAGANMSSRLKDLSDHIRIDKGKKVIMNTYTFYQEYATYGDAVMKESAFSRWGGNVNNPTYSWEDMSIEKDRADFYASHNIPVLGMSFGNLTNYDKMSFDYAAFAVLYGLSGNNSFRYGQPNFQAQKEIMMYPLGAILEPSYTETSATDWNRLYQNGRVHINPVDHTWSVYDNKEVNNMSVKLYLYSGAQGSGDRNVYVFSNTNDSIVTIPYNAGVDPVGSWVYRSAYLNITEYKDHGHYYIYAYTRPNAGGWNFIGKAPADPTGNLKTWYDTTTNNLPYTTEDQTWNTVSPRNFMVNMSVNYTTSKYLDKLVSRISQTQSQVLGYNYVNSSDTYDFAIPIWHGEVFISTSSYADTYVKNLSGLWQELNVSDISDAGSSDITWNYTTVDGGQYGAVRELISADYYKYRYLSPHMSLHQFKSGTLLTSPSISNITNGSISPTSQWIKWEINQTAHNRVVYDKGSAGADSTACEGQWSATHACANASDGNWSSYAESAGALLAYAYFNYTVPTGASQVESLWHVKDAAGHANITIPSACWGGTLYLRAMGSDIGNSITWQCDDGPGWTNIRSSVANIAYEQKMKFKYTSSWDNSTTAPNITLYGLIASTLYEYQVWSYNTTNTSLSDNSSTLNFTTAAAAPSTNPITITGGNRALFCNWSANTTFANIAANLTNCTDFFYYNSTSQKWIFYNVNRTINANTFIHKHAAIFVCFNNTTTVECDILAAETITIPSNVWYYTALRESTSKTLTEINTAIAADGCTINDLCAWNSTTGAYTNTGSYSVLPNEGFAIYCPAGCDWDGGI